MLKRLKSIMADSVLTEEEAAKGLELQKSLPRKKHTAYCAKAEPPLALLSKEEGGQGLQPNPKINGLYVDGDGSSGILYNSQGMRVEEPECHGCLDHGFLLAKPPINRASAGAWDGQLVVCRHKEE